MKGSHTEQPIGAHLYLDIAKSDYLFHGYSSGMQILLAETEAISSSVESIISGLKDNVWLQYPLLPAWISNYIHYNVWDEITYPFLNFNGATVEV